jgi:hypothetical protein
MYHTEHFLLRCQCDVHRVSGVGSAPNLWWSVILIAERLTFLHTQCKRVWVLIVKNSYVYLWILTDIHVFSKLITKIDSWNALYLSVCIHTCMCTLCMDVNLASAWIFGRILFKSGIQEFIHPSSVPGESEHSISENSEPSNGPHNTKWRFPGTRL